ncbi:MAG: VRR-NUC domain-containing protein [Pyrinomonadaceae bacterium]|nr:VRR-NUC domain-containing protein [Pyrinomonadaceae bacterium]
MKNRNLTGGLFDGRGKPQTLKESAKSKKVVTPEKNIQASFIAWRNIHKRQFPILKCIFAVPNGFWTENKAYAAAMVLQGLTEGIQDVICLSPSADGKYHGLLIEFKTESEKSQQSPEQLFFHEFFASLGYRTEVCRSAFSASVIVNEHLGIRVPIYPR